MVAASTQRVVATGQQGALAEQTGGTGACLQARGGCVAGLPARLRQGQQVGGEELRVVPPRLGLQWAMGRVLISVSAKTQHPPSTSPSRHSKPVKGPPSALPAPCLQQLTSRYSAHWKNWHQAALFMLASACSLSGTMSVSCLRTAVGTWQGQARAPGKAR
jgi:hypothetical protein